MRGPAAVQGIGPGGAGPVVKVKKQKSESGKAKRVKVKRKIRSGGAGPEVEGVERVGRVLGGVPLQVATDPATLGQGQSGKGEQKDQLDNHCRVDPFSSKLAIVLVMKTQ